MGQDGDVDGRDFIERQGWAVAPSLAFGLEGDTRTYFYLLHTEQDNIPDGGVSTIGLEGFYNPAFDPSPLPPGSPPGPNAGVVPEPVDPRELLRLRQRLRRDQGHDVHRPHRTRLQRRRHAAQHHALRQAAPVLRAHRRECAHRDGSEPRCVDRGAHAPGEVPGKHAAHQPDQHRLECEHRRRRPRHHRRLRVHRRRAVQPDLRRARHAAPRRMSTTRTATTCCPTTRRCATACTRAAKRRPPACTCSTP